MHLILYFLCCTVGTWELWIISTKYLYFENLSYMKKQQEQAEAHTKQYHQSNQQWKPVLTSSWLLSLTGRCFLALGLVMTIPFRVLGHKREEVCILTILPRHVLPAGRCLSIVGPWTFTSILADGWILLDLAKVQIVAALTMAMAVTVLNGSQGKGWWC